MKRKQKDIIMPSHPPKKNKEIRKYTRTMIK